MFVGSRRWKFGITVGTSNEIHAIYELLVVSYSMNFLLLEIHAVYEVVTGGLTNLDVLEVMKGLDLSNHEGKDITILIQDPRYIHAFFFFFWE